MKDPCLIKASKRKRGYNLTLSNPWCYLALVLPGYYKLAELKDEKVLEEPTSQFSKEKLSLYDK